MKYSFRALLLGAAVTTATIVVAPLTHASANDTDACHGVSGVSFLLKGADGTIRTTATLSGQTKPGDLVTATFTVPSGCANQTFSLVSYRAPDGSFDPATASQQTLYKFASGAFSSGAHTLTVAVPGGPAAPISTKKAGGKPCVGCVGNADDKNPKGQMPNASLDGNNGYECDKNKGVGPGNPAHSGCMPSQCYQLDFVSGAVLATLGPVGTNNFYGDRVIDSDLGCGVRSATVTANT